MSTNVAEFLPLVELLLKVGVSEVERRRQRPVASMSSAEVRLAAHELLAEVIPWNAPVERTGEQSDD